MPGSSPSQSSNPSVDFPTQESKGFSHLRKVLLGPEQSQLRQLQRRLDSFTLHPDEVSRVLPDAIRLRAQQDSRLLATMVPVTQEALAVSIKQSPHLIVDAMAPILGPAIRKATVQAMRGMLQSLNQSLEYSMSWKGLQWRWEAWRTGKTFGEVVLLHTLHFRVEQVFLIHKQSGLLLNHVVAEGVKTQGEELISSMLTAIQDFVRDSFGGPHEEGLESLRIGELTVWIEQGSQAILAGVIRGTPPVELRRVFQETLEAIHGQFSDPIQKFQGDATPLHETRLYLEDCLQAQFAQKPSRVPWMVWVLLVMLLCIGGLWGSQSWSDRQRWNQFLDAVGKESGLIITSSKEGLGETVFYGLRDPLAPDPLELLEQVGYSGQAVSFRLEPFLNLTPEFVQRRTRSVLDPPQTVALRWEGSVLYLSGLAPHSWIQKVKLLGPVIPGVDRIDTGLLRNSDWENFQKTSKNLEQGMIAFLIEESIIQESEKPKLSQMWETIASLERQARVLDVEPIIEIQGFSSPDGSEDLNWVLSQDRADSVLRAFSRKTLRKITMKAVGKGPEMSLLSLSDGEASFSKARRVSLQVVVPSLEDRKNLKGKS